ncbi:MAG: hypothetical protein JNL43_13190 [Flavobacteriales bacterium]|nr:hypothetical protein [Flavobacteriales bacterium]HRH70243.1 hypothetical protein [Flavobacteriales bacterium]
MAGERIYYFGRNPSMMALVGQQLSSAGYDPLPFRDELELARALPTGDAKLLVIGSGVEDGPRLELKAMCEKYGVLVFENFGGPTSLVENLERLLG